MRLTPGSDPSVVCSSPDGTVQHIYFDGTVKKFRLKEFSADHSFDIFDVNGDGFGEYIFIDKGVLYVYNHNRTELFSRDFGSENLGGPINFIFSGTDRKIGVFDVNKKLIYLINKEGKQLKDFPSGEHQCSRSGNCRKKADGILLSEVLTGSFIIIRLKLTINSLINDFNSFYINRSDSISDSQIICKVWRRDQVPLQVRTVRIRMAGR